MAIHKIGIIGAGHIGATTARLFIDAGHEVAVSNSRGPETLTGLVQELGPRASCPGSPVQQEVLRLGYYVALETL